MKPKRASPTSVGVRASARSRGLFFCEDEQARQEMLSFLSDYYRVCDYSLSNFNRAAFLLDKPEIGFVVLCGDDQHRIFEALAWIRSRSNVAVMIVGPAIERQCILALEAGADDYIAKPVSLREMLARIRVILRFERPAPIQQHKTKQSSYLFGGWRYDHSIRRLTNAQGIRIFLTKNRMCCPEGVSRCRAPPTYKTLSRLCSPATRGYRG